MQEAKRIWQGAQASFTCTFQCIKPTIFESAPKNTAVMTDDKCNNGDQKRDIDWKKLQQLIRPCVRCLFGRVCLSRCLDVARLTRTNVCPHGETYRLATVGPRTSRSHATVLARYTYDIEMSQRERWDQSVINMVHENKTKISKESHLNGHKHELLTSYHHLLDTDGMYSL